MTPTEWAAFENFMVGSFGLFLVAVGCIIALVLVCGALLVVLQMIFLLLLVCRHGKAGFEMWAEEMEECFLRMETRKRR